MSSLRLALKLSMIENPTVTSTNTAPKETKFDDFDDSHLVKKRKKENLDEDHESKGILKL